MITEHIVTKAHEAANVIAERIPNFKPRLGIVLGSGLGRFADCLEQAIKIPYEELPGFPKVSVQGHGGFLVLGQIGKVQIACLQGRAHLYEGASFEFVKTYVRTLKLLGATQFVATNAAGSLRKEVGPGELVLVTDHINLQPSNPLIGPNDDAFGPRFLPLDNVYDPAIRAELLKIAARSNIRLHEGVYMALAGPCYETVAEIKAFRILGADVVGMSTVPEVIVAHHCGLKVAVISIVSNFATGLTEQTHAHESVVETASRACESLNGLLKNYIQTLEPQAEN